MILLLALTSYNFTANKMIILQTGSGRAVQLIGNVRVKATKADISARYGMYYEVSGLSILHGDALVKGKDYTISSDTLRYIPEPEFLYLSGNAFLEDRYRTISSHNIEVIGDSSVARGDVEIYIKDKDVIIRGDTGYYNLEEKSGKLIGHPTAIINRTDTITISSDTFFMLKDTLWAVGQVNVVSKRATATGDTLITFETGSKAGDTTGPKIERTVLAGGCRVQWNNGWAVSDTVEMISKDGVVQEMVFISNATTYRKESSYALGLQGNRIRAIFKNDELAEIFVDQLSSGVYTGLKTQGER